MAILGDYGGTYSKSPIGLAATQPAIYAFTEKSAEAARQIERIKSIASTCQNDGENSEMRRDSFASSISIITSLLSGPIPIPVASRGEEGCASLFFEGEGFYGDVEIKGKFLEYYLKSMKNGFTRETFDCEEIKDGYIPTRLLTNLFMHFAR